MLPSVVKIAGHDYSVVEGPTVYREGGPGTVHIYNGVISIEAEQMDSLKWSCLWHEAVEVINCLYNLEMCHDSITVLGEQMYRFWSDNFGEVQGQEAWQRNVVSIASPDANAGACR